MALNIKWRSLIEVLEVSDLADLKFNICPGYPPKFLTLEQQEVCAILKTAPISVNSIMTSDLNTDL